MFTVIKLRERIGPGEFGAPFPKIWFPSVPIKVTRTEPDLSNPGIRRFAPATTAEKLICNKVFVFFFSFSSYVLISRYGILFRHRSNRILISSTRREFQFSNKRHRKHRVGAAAINLWSVKEIVQVAAENFC